MLSLWPLKDVSKNLMILGNVSKKGYLGVHYPRKCGGLRLSSTILCSDWELLASISPHTRVLYEDTYLHSKQTTNIETCTRRRKPDLPAQMQCLNFLCIFLCFGAHDWQCSGLIPGSHSAGARGSFEVLGIEVEPFVCKTNTFPAVLAFWPSLIIYS